MGSYLPFNYDDYNDLYSGQNYADPIGLDAYKRKSYVPETTGDEGGFLDFLTHFADETENQLHKTNPISIPKQGLDQLSGMFTGLAKVDPRGEVSAPSIGQVVGPAIYAPPEEEDSPVSTAWKLGLKGLYGPGVSESNPFQNIVSGAVNSGIDLATDPSMGLMAPEAVGAKAAILGGAALAPEMTSGLAEMAGKGWSNFESGDGFGIENQKLLGEALPIAAMLGHSLKSMPESLGSLVPEMKFGDSGYSTRSPLTFEHPDSFGTPDIPNFVSAMAEGGGPRAKGPVEEIFDNLETLKRPREPFRTLAEHGTPNHDNWVERGRSLQPSEDGVYGAGGYLSQITGDAPRYSNRPFRPPENPKVLKGDVSAEKPLFLDEPAPRDLRMKAMIELQKARRAGLVDAESADLAKYTILHPDTTGYDLMMKAEELVRGNIPETERATYEGDPYSDFIKSAGYDLWAPGKKGAPATEMVVPDPRRQFKVGEIYDPRKGAREVLADSSGEAVPRPQSLKNPSVRVSEAKTPETTDIKDWLGESERAKPINVPSVIDTAARKLGYQSNPLEGTISKIQEGSPAEIFAKSQLKRYGADWEKKQSSFEENFYKRLLRRSEDAKFAKVGEEPKSLGETKLSEDPDIRKIQEAEIAKPVKESSLDKAIAKVMAKRPPKTPKNETPVDTITGEPIEKKNWSVTLENGKSYRVRAEDETAAAEKVQELLDKHGNDWKITSIKEKFSTLESDIAVKASPTEVKVAESIAKGQASDIIKEQKTKTKEEKLREAAQMKELKDQLKVEQAKAKAGDKEARLRERAIEKEIRDVLKAEQAYQKSEAIKKQKEYQAKVNQESGWRNSPVVKVLNSAKSIAYGGDVGHLLRQGKQMNVDLLFSKHAKKVVDQIPVIFKSMKSEKYFNDFHEKLASDPTIKLLTEKFGLDMPGIGKGLKEEVFHGEGYAEKIPGLGRFYAKPSERAYTAGLNFLRAAEATKLVGKLKSQGKTPENSPEAYRGIAKAINVISQRGDFSPKTSKQLADASFIFGAPRAKAARIQNLYDLVADGGYSGKVMRRTAGKMLLFNLGMMGLLKAARSNGEVVTDPDRTDFGKFRDGNITIDPWVGLGTSVRTLYQTGNALAGGKAESPHSGREYVQGPTDPVIKELSNMTAPGIRAAFILMTGRDLGTLLTGKPSGGYLVDKKEAPLQIAPLSPKQIAEILAEPGGAEKYIYSAMQIAGEGIDIFDYKKAKKEQERLKKERGIKTKSSKSNTSDFYKKYFD